jgi:hypothetical protein
MNSNYLKGVVLAAAAICSVSAAQAAPITYNFSATNFTAYGGTPVPVNSIAGSFTVDGSIVTQIDFAIGSYSYSAADVEISSIYTLLGGAANGPGITFGTDDFWLQWLPGLPTYFTGFAYTVAGVNDYYSSYTGEISVAAVPVPAAAWLFGSGLIGLAGASRRRKSSI